MLERSASAAIRAHPDRSNSGQGIVRHSVGHAGLAPTIPSWHFRRVPPRNSSSISREIIAIGRRFCARVLDRAKERVHSALRRTS